METWVRRPPPTAHQPRTGSRYWIQNTHEIMQTSLIEQWVERHLLRSGAAKGPLHRHLWFLSTDQCSLSSPNAMAREGFEGVFRRIGGVVAWRRDGAGASVVEVMPVQQFQYGCPCDMYRRMYSVGGPTVLHYQLTTRNGSRAVSTEARKKGTYNSDLFVPWPALRDALAHIVQVGGRKAHYKFRRFPY